MTSARLAWQRDESRFASFDLNVPLHTLTAAWWVNVCNGATLCPSETSQTNAWLSFPPLARYFPSGDQERPHTSCWWWFNVATWCSATRTSWWWMEPLLEPLQSQQRQFSPVKIRLFVLETPEWTRHYKLDWVSNLDRMWAFQDKQPTRAAWPLILRTIFCCPTSQSWIKRNTSCFSQMKMASTEPLQCHKQNPAQALNERTNHLNKATTVPNGKNVSFADPRHRWNVLVRILQFQQACNCTTTSVPQIHCTIQTQGNVVVRRPIQQVEVWKKKYLDPPVNVLNASVTDTHPVFRQSDIPENW